MMFSREIVVVNVGKTQHIWLKSGNTDFWLKQVTNTHAGITLRHTPLKQTKTTNRLQQH